MRYFFMNGYRWQVVFVNPVSPKLVDRTGTARVATTDPLTRCVYLSSSLRGSFLTKVFVHELGHVAIVSFDLMGDIHRMVRPEYWIDAEEWVCNFIADYGMAIFSTAYSVLGRDAIRYLPQQIERMIA